MDLIYLDLVCLIGTPATDDNAAIALGLAFWVCLIIGAYYFGKRQGKKDPKKDPKKNPEKGS